jgi:hypothetical protein
LLEGCQGRKPDGPLRLFRPWAPPAPVRDHVGYASRFVGLHFVILQKRVFSRLLGAPYDRPRHQEVKLETEFLALISIERILMSSRGGVNRRICTYRKLQPTVSIETGHTGFQNRSDRFC